MRRLFCLLVLFLVVGCGGSKYVGYWEGAQTLNAPDIYQNTGKVELTLDPDGKCEYLRLSLYYQGTYEVKDGKVVLNLETSMGQPVLDGHRTVTLTPGESDTLILVDEFAPNTGIRLQRKPKPARTN